MNNKCIIKRPNYYLIQRNLSETGASCHSQQSMSLRVDFSLKALTSGLQQTDRFFKKNISQKLLYEKRLKLDTKKYTITT